MRAWPRCKTNGLCRPTKKAPQAHVLNTDAFAIRPVLQGKKWVLETHFDMHDEAMNDLLKECQAQLTKIPTKFKKNLHMCFHSKRDEVQSIAVLAKHYNSTKKGQFAFLKYVCRGEKETLPS